MSLLCSCAGLAGTYKAAKQWEDAQECLQRAVDLDAQNYGPQHPRVAKDKVNQLFPAGQGTASPIPAAFPVMDVPAPARGCVQ